ncbi:hypothetical protein CORI_0246 [Campylobacter sp. CCUG 57310]|nr:hypothetical protein CORI_0246 [Campylobacter sp. CCUG 57310]
MAFVFFIAIFCDGKELAVINDIDEVILNFKNISGNKIEFKIIYENCYIGIRIDDEQGGTAVF